MACAFRRVAWMQRWCVLGGTCGGHEEDYCTPVPGAQLASQLQPRAPPREQPPLTISHHSPAFPFPSIRHPPRLPLPSLPSTPLQLLLTQAAHVGAPAGQHGPGAGRQHVEGVALADVLHVELLGGLVTRGVAAHGAARQRWRNMGVSKREGEGGKLGMDGCWRRVITSVGLPFSTSQLPLQQLLR